MKNFTIGKNGYRVIIFKSYTIFPSYTMFFTEIFSIYLYINLGKYYNKEKTDKKNLLDKIQTYFTSRKTARSCDTDNIDTKLFITN